MKLELSHDILAKKVYERVSAEDKTLRKMERFIADRYSFYEGKSNKLTREEISYISPYLAKVDIPDRERQFIHEGMRGHQRKRMFVIILLGLIFIGLFAAASTFFNFWRDAERLRAEAVSLQQAADSARSDAEIQKKVAEGNLLIAEAERFRADSQSRRAEYQATLATASAIAATASATAAKRSAQKADSARKEAVIARELAVTAQKSDSIAREKADSLRIVAERKAQVANLLTAQSMASQSLAIEDDIRLKTLLAREARCIHDEYGGNPYDANIYNALYQSEKSFNQQQNRPDGISFRHSFNGAVRSIRFTQQPLQMYSLGSDGKLQDYPLGEVSRSPEGTNLLVKETLRGLSLDVSPNGKSVAAGGEAPFLYLSRVDAGGKETFERVSLRQDLGEMATDTLVSLVFRDNQHLLFSLLNARKLVEIDLKSGLQTVLLDGSQLSLGLRNLTASGDGQYLAALTGQGEIRMWRFSPEGGLDEMPPLPKTSGIQPYSLSFNPQRPQLAVGTKNGLVYLFDMASDPKSNPELLRGHIRTVSMVRFSPDGRQLASSSFDGTVRLWQLETDYLRKGPLVLAPEYPFSTGDLWAFSLDFSPDGNYLAAGYANGQIQYWPTQFGYWFAQLNDNNRTERFTPAEWDTYIGDEIPYPSSGSICPNE